MPRAAGSPSLHIGDRAPDFELPQAGSEGMVRRSDYDGNWLFLVFLRHAW